MLIWVQNATLAIECHHLWPSSTELSCDTSSRPSNYIPASTLCHHVLGCRTQQKSSSKLRGWFLLIRTCPVRLQDILCFLCVLKNWGTIFAESDKPNPIFFCRCGLRSYPWTRGSRGILTRLISPFSSLSSLTAWDRHSSVKYIIVFSFFVLLFLYHK